MNRCVETEYGEISYELTKKKVKNINLRIKPSGLVMVSAPPRVSVKDLDQFVVDKAEFVFRALKEFEKKRANSPSYVQNYTQGGTVYYLGQPLSLEIQSGADRKGERVGNYMRVVCSEPENPERVQNLVQKFYQEECVNLFQELMRAYQLRLMELNIPQASLKIRDMKSRWGTCHTVKHVITLNSKLIYAPYGSVEYVVLHEFCHLVHPNHSKDFYNLVGRYMPDWKARREELKKWSCRE